MVNVEWCDGGGGVVIIQPTDGMYMDASMYYVI